MRVLLGVALALLLAPAAVAQTSDVSPDSCVPRQEATDPAGDVQGRAPVLPPPTDLSPMDLLGVAMWREEEGLGLSGTLAADPRASDAQFYYWISFEAEKPAAGGNPATWTFQRTSTYEALSTMYWDARDDYPVTWEGMTFSFLLPWEDLGAQYGADWPMDIGSPSLSSAGPILVQDPTGITGYPEYVQTTLGWGDWVEHSRDLVPLPDCPAATATMAEPASSSNATPGQSSPNGAHAADDGAAQTSATKDAPASGLLAAGALVVVALALRRRG